ncbi:hypothetical protein V6N13_092721 [Hibiscus sabdariffa]|uniref:Uncharacterized protein n=2 Tax=Hibiscus sabdariffa TaxID=183260 RepID=A0ABR2P7S9_9ROSI
MVVVEFREEVGGRVSGRTMGTCDRRESIPVTCKSAELAVYMWNEGDVGQWPMVADRETFSEHNYQHIIVGLTVAHNFVWSTNQIALMKAKQLKSLMIGTEIIKDGMDLRFRDNVRDYYLDIILMIDK